MEVSDPADNENRNIFHRSLLRTNISVFEESETHNGEISPVQRNHADHTFNIVSTGTISLQSPTRSCSPIEIISSGLMKIAVSS